MEYNTENQRHNMTWLAIIVAVVLVIACFFLAGLAVIVFNFLSAVGMRGSEEGSWIPVLGGIWKIVWVILAPEFVRGAVALSAAIMAVFWLFKRTNRESVTYAVVTVYGTLAAGLTLYALATTHFRPESLEGFGLIAGIVAGGYFALSTSSQSRG